MRGGEKRKQTSDVDKSNKKTKRTDLTIKPVPIQGKLVFCFTCKTTY